MLIPLTDSPQIRHANQKAERCLFTGTATFPSQVAWLQGIKLYIVTARMSVYLNILYLSRAKNMCQIRGLPTASTDPAMRGDEGSRRPFGAGKRNCSTRTYQRRSLILMLIQTYTYTTLQNTSAGRIWSYANVWNRVHAVNVKRQQRVCLWDYFTVLLSNGSYEVRASSCPGC